MAVRGVDNDAIDAGIHQHQRAVVTLVADGRSRSDAQAAFGVLAGIGIERRLLDVLHRDESDAAPVVIDDEQFLDAVLMQKPARLVFGHAAFANRHELPRHQFGDRHLRIGGKAHVAIGQDAAEFAGASVVAARHDGNAGNAVALHQRQRVGKRLVGIDGDRIDHHAALVALHLAHFVGLLLRLEIAVDDADAAGLRHGNGEPRFGHRVHRRGDDRDIERDRAGEPRPDIDAARHDLGMAGRQQDVVEGQGFPERAVCNGVCQHMSPGGLAGRGTGIGRRSSWQRLIARKSRGAKGNSWGGQTL